MRPLEFLSFRARIAEARRSRDLFFASLLDRDAIKSVFGDASAILDSASIYNTATTLWVFLSQVLSIDHGCVAAIAKFIAFRRGRGQKACSARSGGYCIARDQLDEQAMQRLVTHTGAAIERQAPEHWLWLGHRVITADGTTITMADTEANQAEYPQLQAQAAGCGFPIMRVVVMFALATGTVLESAAGRYRGKLTAEVSLFRTIDACVGENDVFLGDRAYAGWFDMARLMGRGAHVVVRKHQLRHSDFRTGVRYGHDDHTIFLPRPARPDWMTVEEYESYPATLRLRELRVRIDVPGFRVQELIVHTSLHDANAYRKEDIAALYRRRWEAELNLRALKTVMQMDHLRCKLPHRVRNELRTHLIAYNLIRQVMAEAALAGGIQPWRISFKGTLTTVVEMIPILGASPLADDIYETLLQCCRSHEVGNRPNRYEPRVCKRRPKPHKLMQKPRHCYKPNEA